MRVACYGQRWRRRLLVEQLCGPALVGGPAIEFCDGLMPIDTVDARVPKTIGTLDLTVCDSVLLAEYLRRRRSGGVILANPRPATPDVRLAMYREAIGFMNRYHVSYVDAMLRLRRSLARLA